MLPWALLAADRLAAGRWRRAGILGLVLGVALYGGHPETWFVLLCGAVAILSARAIDRRRAGWRPSLLIMLAAFAVAALIGALYLLPFAELLTHAARATRGGAHPDSLRQLSVGLLFPEWWGRTDKTVYDAHVSLTTLSSLFPGRPYLGVAPLLAAVASLAVPTRRAQRFYFALGAAAVAIMIDVPGLRQLVTHVPPFSRMNPHHFVWLAALCLAMLGGLGLEAILRASRSEQLRALRGALLFVALTTLVALALNPGLVSALPRGLGQLPALEQAPGAELASAGALVRWVLFSALALLGAWWVMRRPRRALVAAVGLLAFTAADLVTIDRGINPVLPASLAHLPAPPALTLASNRGWGRIAGPYTVAAPSIATLYGLADARVNDLPAIKRYSDTFAALGGVADFAQGASYIGAIPSFGEQLGALPGARTRDLLDLLGARFVIDGGGARPRAEGVHVGGLGNGWRVLVDDAAFPRAWVAYDWRPVSGLAPAVQAIRASSIRALRTRPVIETTTAPPDNPLPNPSPASVVTAGDRTVTVQARLGRPGYLVLDDLFYPGWKATVDGHAAPIRPADGLLRAVQLPAGLHAVRFNYDPESVTIGGVLTVVGLLIGAAAVLAGIIAWVRQRSQAGET
jgi:hypothetical protein